MLLNVAIMSSCSDLSEGFDAPDAGCAGSLSFYASDMVPQFTGPSDVASRAGDPKTEKEKEIKTLHVFFFNSDGTLANLDYDNFTAYQKVRGNVITVPQEAINANALKGLRIVAIANINGADGEPIDANAIGTASDPNMFCTGSTSNGKIENGTRGTDNPYKIEKYEDLEKWVYRPKLRSEEKTPVTDLPKAGMPMIGEYTVPNDASFNGSITVPMKAMMARVDISVKLQPNQESLDGQLPRMTIESFGVMNMPSTVPFAEPTVTDVVKEDDKNEVDTKKIESEFKITLDNPVTIDKNTATPPVFTYYTYENIQEAKGTIESVVPADLQKLIEDQKYTEKEKEKVMQRWKPKIAQTDRASALVLTGSYTTHQGMRYQARFTVYMGENTLDNFEVKRNHKYNNYITIHGLDYVRNTDDNAYTFDGRVNVVTDNPIYLAMVNERKVDAHASVRPMDVWLLLREPAPGEPADKMPVVTHNSTVTVTIPDDCDWISMVMIPRKVMEVNQFKAGTGAEPYFYTDMIDRINNGRILENHVGQDGVKCGKTVTIESHSDLNNSRSRIYFYIDENVDVSKADYGKRYARISVDYKNDLGTGDHRQYSIVIEQQGLVKVSGDWISNDGRTTDPIDTYMEYYEEYLEHSDPLDKHVQPGQLYEGLKWGLMGTSLNNSGFSGWNDIWYKSAALGMTKWIIERSGTSVSTVTLFGDDAPASAFHYCFGKNKRENDGTVNAQRYGNPDPDIKMWYMPGIRELEKALVQYYGTFEDFQGNLYWSASGGWPGSGWSANATEYARASKVVFNTAGNPQFVQSGAFGEEGCLKRDSYARIRAFYRADNGTK